MNINYKQLQKIIKSIRDTHGFTYLTRKKCKQLYGFSWKVKDYYNVTVKFEDSTSEVVFKLKYFEPNV